MKRTVLVLAVLFGLVSGVWGQASNIWYDLHRGNFPASNTMMPVSGVGYLMAYGTTVPTDAGSGYAPGCIFIHTDGTAGTQFYINEGTYTSCDFNRTEAGNVGFLDNEILAFGTVSDVTVTWDATNLRIRPLTDDTGQIIIGDGTNDMDLRVIMGSAAADVLFDNGDARVLLDGVDLVLETSDMLELGDARPFRIYSDGSNAIIGPATDDAGELRINGDFLNSLAADLSIYDTTTAYWRFNVGLAKLIAEGVDINLMNDDQLFFGDNEQATMEYDSTRGALVTDPGGAFNSPEGISDRYRLTWIAGEQGVVAPNARIADSTADQHFELLGTNAAYQNVTVDATGGLLITTAGAGADEMIILPHLDPNQTGWTSTVWGTEKEIRWDGLIKTGAAAQILDVTIYAGLKLTDDVLWETDNDSAFFVFHATDTGGTWYFCSSVGGSDTQADTGTAVAADTSYHLTIEVDSSRVARAYVNGVYEAMSAALTDNVDLIPYIGLVDSAGAAKSMYVRQQAMSQAY